ncbi:sulfatase family protein [Paenibacillus aceris]|uniref:Arylsulfatase A-like enzyme n=1 Tax=Paenibacillus aceris TaxID=869555 RepID=A0ABS4HQC4_9BACL|nr:sulfatase-like hydrolase/transferase [Paenibacillus aceris]MBP1960817.1 arylsulfatase A-like enzyme [Paenibacillus aceris]NHW35504.1 sulfatase-like hydrolase/transferase [Paenibacillus aceris]
MTKPNILFLFPDQHRGDWLPFGQEVWNEPGIESLPIQMPNLQKLMQRGTTFTKAITPSPLCAPARACLASGLRYHRCGVEGNHDNYPLEQRTFYSVLKEQGYNVGGVGKFDLHKASHWWGLDGWIDELGTLGFTHGVDNAGKIDAIVSGREEPKDPYMQFLYERGLADIHLKDMTGRGNSTLQTELPDDAYCDNWLSQNGVRLLREFQQDQPWFMVVNFTGPHNPWDVTQSMKERWKDIPFPLPVGSELDPAEITEIRQNYAAMLENIDRNVGMLLAEVEARGEIDRTVIIYASDHGEMLGDYNKFGKTRPERASVHIPLVISGPGILEHVHSEALVELQDLAGTIVELAGGTMEEAKDSASLVPILMGKHVAHRPYQISALSKIKNNGSTWISISDGQYKLIVSGEQDKRLYSVISDPWETENIASVEEETVTRLENALRDEIR